MSDDQKVQPTSLGFDDGRLAALGRVYTALCDRQVHYREIGAAIDILEAHRPGTLPVPALVLKVPGGRVLNLTCLTGVEQANDEHNIPLDAKERESLLRFLRYRLQRVGVDVERLYRESVTVRVKTKGGDGGAT